MIAAANQTLFVLNTLDALFIGAESYLQNTARSATQPDERAACVRATGEDDANSTAMLLERA